ncbi:MAG: ATPase domain-containing protein [Halobacteriaceae archaeon]
MSHRDLYSLGMEDRDQLNNELGGGIPPGSIMLIEGEYGAGKSVLSQRFNYGLCQEGTVVTHLSTEFTTDGFIQQMHSLDYDATELLLNQQLLFLHADLDSGEAFSEEDGARKDLLNRLMDAEVMWDADVVTIDTFDAILRNDPQFEALVRNNEERQAALEIISFFRDVVSDGSVIMLTVDPTTVGEEAIGPFRSIADIYLELQMVEVGNDVRRNISVKRFAGMGEQVGDTIGYSVRSGAGVVVESRSVA